MCEDPIGALNVKAKPYRRMCTQCGETAVMSADIAYDAEVKHDGRLHRFPISRLAIDKCQRCGEEFFTNRTDEQIAAALRDHLGLLQPQDIRRRLDELGLTQRSFAARLGVAPETVSRWPADVFMITVERSIAGRSEFRLADLEERQVPIDEPAREVSKADLRPFMSPVHTSGRNTPGSTEKYRASLLTLSLLIWRRPDRTLVIVERGMPVARATSAFVTCLASIRWASVSAGDGLRLGNWSTS
jgi:hypothetical protein